MDDRPIGVFDSGLGGLTAVRELLRLLPNEDIVYFGDTGRAPYGTKGRETIARFAAQDVRFLKGFDVKAVVIACATVSSSAFGTVCREADVPVVGVIEPTAAAAARATRNERVTVLGTSATIRSGAFERALLAADPKLSVASRACPLFVPLVENGFFAPDDPIAALAAHRYLDGLRGGADTFILGCTHYPILREAIASVLGEGVTLVDAGRETARAAAGLLAKKGLCRAGRVPGRARYFVSDRTDDFARLAGTLLGGPIGEVGLVEIDRF